MADDRNDLNELMTALGSVVVVWGMIEDITRHFLTEVALGNDVDDRVDLIIISEIPFRTQLDILKKVAYVRRSNCEWFDRLFMLINDLSTSMHAERNRLIHDLWEKNDDGQIIKYVRGKEEATVAKKKGDWTLKLTGERAVPVDEVEAFFEKAANCADELLALKSEYVEWKFEAAKKNHFKDLADKIRERGLSKTARSELDLTALTIKPPKDE